MTRGAEARAFALRHLNIHRGVSHTSLLWEYGVWLSSRYGRPGFRVWPEIAIVPSAAACALQDLARCRTWAAAAREITTMATSYQGNVTPQVPAAQDGAAGPVIRTIGLSDLHRALRLGWGDFKAGPRPH